MGKSVGEKETHARPIILLSDDPIKSSLDDKFSQETFVSKLVNIFESNKNHFNVGLFGKWGTGKTGILNMLKEKLDENKFDYFYIDSWKLSKDSVRQQLLFELSKIYDPESGEEALTNKLFNITVKQVKESDKNIWDTLSRLFANSFLYFIFAAIVLILGLLFESQYPNNGVLTIFSTFIVAPLIVELIKELSNTRKTVEKSGMKIIPRVESAFQFERIFCELIGKREKNKKIIIAVDNLDRCESDLVIDMLSTIKTFMETDDVFFVIACDDNALFEHLKNLKGFTIDNSREFLRKFFQICVNIPPFIEGNLLNYIDELTQKLNVIINQNVKEVLFAASIDNPRRIKQLLNNYVITYHLSTERENKGIVAKGVLTGNLGFLAKIMILREMFPKFYDKLSKKDDLLNQIETHFKNDLKDTFEEKDLQVILNENPGLEWFLQRTRPVNVSDINPFIRLGQETYENLLPKLEELRLKVRSNDLNYILKTLNNMSYQERLNLVRVILKILRKDASEKSTVIAFNELNVLLMIKDDVPQKVTNELIHHFEQICSTQFMLPQLLKFDAEKVFSIMPFMQQTYRDQIIIEYMNQTIESKAINEEIFKLILGNQDLVSHRAKMVLNSLLVRLNKNNELLSRQLLSKIYNSSKKEHTLINQQFIQSIITRISPNEFEQNMHRINSYMETKELATNSTKQIFVKQLMKVITVPKTAPDGEVNLVLETLSKLKEDDVPKSVSDFVVTKIALVITNMNHISHKIQVLRPIIPHLHKLTEEIKEKFFKESLKPILTAGSSNEILTLLDDFSESNLNILSNDGLFQELAKRSSKNIFDPKLIGYILQKTPKEKAKDAVDLVIANITSKKNPNYSTALDAFKNNSQHLPINEVDRVCSSIVKTSKDFSDNQKAKFFETLGLIASNCSQNAKNEIVDELLELLKQPEPLQKIGINTFKKIESVITNKIKLRIFRQLIINLSSPPKTRNSPILDLIFENQDVINKDDSLRLIDYLRGYISTSQSQDIQIKSLEYLLKIPNLFDRTKEILEATLLIATSGNNDLKNLIILFHKKFLNQIDDKQYLQKAEQILGEDITKT